jgi:hypothetical protein
MMNIFGTSHQPHGLATINSQFSLEFENNSIAYGLCRYRSYIQFPRCAVPFLSHFIDLDDQTCAIISSHSISQVPQWNRTPPYPTIFYIICPN